MRFGCLNIYLFSRSRAVFSGSFRVINNVWFFDILGSPTLEPTSLHSYIFAPSILSIFLPEPTPAPSLRLFFHVSLRVLSFSLLSTPSSLFTPAPFHTHSSSHTSLLLFSSLLSSPSPLLLLPPLYLFTSPSFLLFLSLFFRPFSPSCPPPAGARPYLESSFLAAPSFGDSFLASGSILTCRGFQM